MKRICLLLFLAALAVPVAILMMDMGILLGLIKLIGQKRSTNIDTYVDK